MQLPQPRDAAITRNPGYRANGLLSARLATCSSLMMSQNRVAKRWWSPRQRAFESLHQCRDYSPPFTHLLVEWVVKVPSQLDRSACPLSSSVLKRVPLLPSRGYVMGNSPLSSHILDAVSNPPSIATLHLTLLSPSYNDLFGTM